jgi:integrase
MTTPPKYAIPNPNINLGGGIFMQWAKCYRRADTKSERWVVYLNWQGKRWTRTNFDGTHPVYTNEMATALCAEINGEIRKNPKAFRPEKWFGRGNDFKFERYSKRWLSRKQADLQESSYGSYAKVIESAMATMGNFDMAEIKSGTIQDFLNGLLGHGSQVNASKVLKALFRDAFNREDIDRVPGFPRLRGQAGRKSGLSKQVQAELLEALPIPDRPIFEFLRYTGCRVSEAIALKWDCVLWSSHRVVFRRTISGSKLRESRKAGDRLPLPMSETIEDMLRTLSRKNPFSEWVFLNGSGRRYRRQYLDRKLREACLSVGVESVGCHVFARHSKGSQLITEGYSIDVVAAVLGHKNPATTRRHYAKVGTDGLEGVLE